jgi:HSP20 family molecular chaperone IbpA
MAIRNPDSWMWAEACEMLERAQRMQRQFFRFGQTIQSQARWEPPIDIVASDTDIEISIALPGVAPECVQLRIDHGALRLEAVRAVPMNERTTQIHRLEIPYGRFERQIALPPGRYELKERTFINGCLLLRLAKR